jgi:hypothetical protein
MTETIHDKIKRSLQSAEGLYHRLVLLVGETGSGKTGVLRDVAEEFGTSIINVNLALSSELLELTEKQRSLRLPGILDQIADKASAPVVLDNLEILFDKDLKQEPLAVAAGYFEKSGRSGFVERYFYRREAFVRRNWPFRVPQL